MKGMCLVGIFLLSQGVLAAEPAVPAKPLLHPLFSDEAVLQRGKPVAVWGWAAPGAEVTVVLAGEGLAAKPSTVKAGSDGRWQAAIGPFLAGGPYTLTVGAGDQKAAAKDVLVGDVWLCSGQSNMEWPVSKAKDFEAEKAKADFPRLRHLEVVAANAASRTPKELIKGKWKVCTPDTVGGFTAVGYFFGRELHQELKIPIGLVHSSQGGSLAEAWTSAERLAAEPELAKPFADYQKLIEDIAEQRERTGKEYPEQLADWYQANDPGTAARPAWSAPECDAAAWGTVNLPAILEYVGAIPKTYDGTIWLRREVVLPAEAEGKHATLNLGTIDDSDTTWVNGQKVGGMDYQFERRIYSLPAKLLKAGANTIAVRVLDLGNTAGLSANPKDLSLVFDDGAIIPLAGAWRVHTGVELRSAAPLPLTRFRTPGPTTLYNGMIAPLLPLSLTGVIWYQGESNVGHDTYPYRSLLPALIGDWRARFRQGDIPFLIVSLANRSLRLAKPAESALAELREAQALTAKILPMCGLATTIDVGEVDVHPKDKQPVGHRLALAAQAIAYGQQVEWSGPWYKAMTVEGAAIRLAFDHLGGGLVASDGAALTGFAIAGEDRVFVWAEARIDGNTLVVSSPQVANPAAVRYAWADNPACNLANKAGLPAVPFRTDDWQRPKPAPH